MKAESVTMIFLLLIIGLVSGCGKLASLTGNSSASKENFAALTSKKNELANFQPTAAPSLSDKEIPKIKGKVAIVSKDADGKIVLDRFSDDGRFSDLSGSKDSLFYPPEVYAKTPDEIDTLIKIECREYKGKADYQYGYNSNSSSEYKEYVSTICNVSIIDYKTKTLLAKVQKGDESAPTILKSGGNKYEIIEEVTKYLTGLPLELAPKVKPTPAGGPMPVADIAKLFKTSKESLSKYQDKEITLSGWGSINDTRDSILLYGNEKRSGIDQVSCKIDPKDAADFAEMKAYGDYKITVVGKFDGKYTMSLLQCRYISAEQVTKK